DQIVGGPAQALGHPGAKRLRAKVRERAGLAGRETHRARQGLPPARHGRELEIAEFASQHRDRARGVRIVRHEGQGEAVLPGEMPRELILARASYGAPGRREPSAEHENVHGRYRVSIGPMTLVNGRGSRFQVSTARCILGLDGLRFGIAWPSARMYW